MTNEQAALQYYRCINDRDLDRLTALVSDQCKLVDVAQGEILTGKNALREDCENWLAGFPDARLEVLNLIPAGDWVTVEYLARGTHTGQLGKGSDAIAPTNRKVELHFCDVLRLESGKIVAVNSYYDEATLMRQLEVGTQPATKRDFPEMRAH